ncbi:MAG: hypothetical protein LBR91_02210 [Puniceicoccales bacterium]|jgi:hypothetical protein|nr:hypothetical protein [Puniceicoccales bacterium]
MYDPENGSEQRMAAAFFVNLNFDKKFKNFSENQTKELSLMKKFYHSRTSASEVKNSIINRSNDKPAI